MKVLRVEPLVKPEIKEINGDLESLQKEVGGLIEAIYPFDDDAVVICNEEGKINGMELNRALRDDDGEIFDIIAGPFLIAGISEDSFVGLSEEQLKRYTEQFRKPEMFARKNGMIVAVRLDLDIEKARMDNER